MLKVTLRYARSVLSALASAISRPPLLLSSTGHQQQEVLPESRGAPLASRELLRSAPAFRPETQATGGEPGTVLLLDASERLLRRHDEANGGKRGKCIAHVTEGQHQQERTPFVHLQPRRPSFSPADVGQCYL